MMEFRLICEGQTDHAVIKNILFGYFSDPDLIIKALQPDTDESNEKSLKPKHENTPESFGNWYKVFDYCSSDRFFRAFDDKNVFIVIQIDTDCAHDKKYNVTTTDAQGKKLSALEIVNNVQQKFENLFVEKFGIDFLNNNQHRILYAISVDEIECWLLPLHYADNTKAAVTNCLFKLNQQLAKDNEKTIPRGKEGSVSIYRKISKPYMKNKVLMDKYHQNPSFKIFIENELQTKIPLIDKENTASV